MIKGIAIVFLTVIVAGVAFLVQARRDLPFQEIIALDRSIAIVNARNWYLDDIGISISPGSSHDTLLLKYDKNGVCVQRNLKNNQRYIVSLYRTDFKGRLLYKKKTTTVTPKNPGDKYIVLVGASVGSGWHFDLLRQRIKIPPNVTLGFRPHYYFDKTKIIESIIKLPIPVYSVIIKECSAYFPRDTKKSINVVKQWIAQLQAKGILPVLATVVPVTEKRDRLSPGKMTSLLQYNDTLRGLAVELGLPVLDLEKTLRISDKNRHLREEYAQKDGTHLTAAGYTALDRMLENNINRIFRINE